MARLESVFRGWDKCEVPVRLVSESLLAGYRVLTREKLESESEHEGLRKLYNTEQVLFNVCNITAVATFVLVCLRYLPLCLATVVTTASFWVARELVLQDATELEKNDVLGCVIEGHKKVDGNWKANIEGVGVIWARRTVPSVSDENISAGRLAIAAIKERVKEGANKFIGEGQERLEQIIDEGQKFVQEQIYPPLKEEN